VSEDVIALLGTGAWKTNGTDREFWRQNTGRLRFDLGCNTTAVTANLGCNTAAVTPNLGYNTTAVTANPPEFSFPVLHPSLTKPQLHKHLNL
jgi:hypothetical protein